MIPIQSLFVNNAKKPSLNRTDVNKIHYFCDIY